MGDALEKLRELAPESVHACVTDPPYGISFMGKEWDYDVPSIELWHEIHRVLKPGAHLLSFGGTRTWHRIALNIESAGFEIRDTICWLYGTGFPKSLNVSKAVEKIDATLAGKWNDWGTALKPAFEPILVVRKLLNGTVSEGVIAHGTGALNVGATRIAYDGPVKNTERQDTIEKTNPGGWREVKRTPNRPATPTAAGRFPANVIVDEVAAEMLDEQSLAGGMHSAGKARKAGESDQDGVGGLFGVGNHDGNGARFGDTGGASRFFYCAKASRSERGKGNTHPTVKPLKLMSYLVRLVTPPGGTVLDPFAGSGTTLVAAASQGFQYIGIELNPAYAKMAEERIRGTQLEAPT